MDGNGQVDAGGVLTAAVVANDELVRRGIEAELESVPEVSRVWGCAAADEFASRARQEKVDVVVATAGDAELLPGIHPELETAGVTLLVVIDRATLEELSGCAVPADGFLWQEDLTPARLAEALRHCRGGEVPMPPDLARALLARADGSGPGPRGGKASLTSREREALSLLVRGLSNKQIARELSISSHGAKRLVTSIMVKLDAPNRTLAAVTAVQSGLVDPP